MRYNLKQKERLKLKEVRPRQDSNLESSDPKSDALSIRPRGQDNYMGNFDARDDAIDARSSVVWISAVQSLIF